MHNSHKHLCAIDHREFAQPKLTRKETKAYASSKRLSERVGGLGADTNTDTLGPGDLFILPTQLLEQVKPGNRASLAVGLISKEAHARDPYEKLHQLIPAHQELAITIVRGYVHANQALFPWVADSNISEFAFGRICDLQGDMLRSTFPLALQLELVRELHTYYSLLWLVKEANEISGEAAINSTTVMERIRALEETCWATCKLPDLAGALVHLARETLFHEWTLDSIQNTSGQALPELSDQAMRKADDRLMLRISRKQEQLTAGVPQ